MYGKRLWGIRRDRVFALNIECLFPRALSGAFVFRGALHSLAPVQTPQTGLYFSDRRTGAMRNTAQPPLRGPLSSFMFAR
jgi:hypothetical protein